MTSRFNDRCLDYLPVDLNSVLYKYEVDLAEAYFILKNEAKHIFYKEQAERSKLYHLCTIKS
jgi:alpha,alpha-trehalase